MACWSRYLLSFPKLNLVMRGHLLCGKTPATPTFHSILIPSFDQVYACHGVQRRHAAEYAAARADKP
jgi:hypothetical protein